MCIDCKREKQMGNDSKIKTYGYTIIIDACNTDMKLFDSLKVNAITKQAILLATVGVSRGYTDHYQGRGHSIRPPCHAMKTKGMVFRYTWVYSKEDTMAHTRRPVVTS